MNDLKNKRIVLTGASSGIGKELMIRLLEDSSLVFAVVKTGEKIAFHHDNLHVYECDVSNVNQLDEMFKNAVEKLGEIDIFIANAGFAYYEKLEGANWEHIEQIYKTNVFSVIYLAQKMKELMGNKPYQFVTTASAMGYISLPGYTLYSSTKAAIKSFSEGYRMELEKNQIFQVVYPISTRTNFFNKTGGSPVPFPSQSVETVAKAIIKGIKTKKKRIYPSKLFLTILLLDRLFPIISKLYVHAEKIKLDSWLREEGAR